MEDNKVGVINEVGDLGLGFYPITEQQEETVQNNEDSKEN